MAKKVTNIGKDLLPLNLLIANKDNSLNAAVRFFDKGKQQVFYGSTRLDTIKRIEGGYLVENVDAYAGMDYELKIIESGQVLKGVVSIPDPVKATETPNSKSGSGNE